MGEQLGHVAGQQADEAGHADAREQVGGGHAGAGGLGAQAPFGGLHVGPAAQELGGVADRQRLDQGRQRRWPRGASVCVERAGPQAEQHRQPVAGRRLLGLQLGDGGLGGRQPRPGALHVHRIAAAHLEAHLGEAHGLALGVLVLLGHRAAAPGRRAGRSSCGPPRPSPSPWRRAGRRRRRRRRRGRPPPRGARGRTGRSPRRRRSRRRRSRSADGWSRSPGCCVAAVVGRARGHARQQVELGVLEDGAGLAHPGHRLLRSRLPATARPTGRPAPGPRTPSTRPRPAPRRRSTPWDRR